MGDSERSLLKAIKHYQECLERYVANRNESKMLYCLEKLHGLPIMVPHLEHTGVGRTVNGLRKNGGDVGESAKALVIKWKAMVLGEQEDDDEDDDDHEDGYESGDVESSEKEEIADKKPEPTSHKSHHDAESSDHGKSGKKSKSSDELTSSKHKDRHGASSSQKPSKRRPVDDSSDEERQDKRRRNVSSDEERPRERKHKSKQHESGDVVKEKRHKSGEKTKKVRDSSPESDEKHKSREKGHHSKKDRHKKSEARKEEAKKVEKTGSKSRSKDEARKGSKEGKSREHKEKGKGEVASKNGAIMGIDSGSGASFAEALGMCEPSSSKGGQKKRDKGGESKERRDKSHSRCDETVPKVSKEPSLDSIDLSSLLPTITPNYRPLGNLLNLDTQPKKILSEYEQLSSIISAKNPRTKVYSGNKTGNGKVPSLFELCIRILQDNIDALEYTGGVPFVVLKPILEKVNPTQLFVLEHHNPYLIEDTDDFWQLHCQKNFRNKKREELETWREMYMRCQDERDAKLKALTANIKQAQDKSLPVRTTKLAYVDDVVKPPRGVLRKQARNGTAFDNKRPALTPSARLSTLATAGEAGKVAVPNPGARAMERAAAVQAVKPKKAPLMLKSLSLMKNRFKR